MTFEICALNVLGSNVLKPDVFELNANWQPFPSSRIFRVITFFSAFVSFILLQLFGSFVFLMYVDAEE